MKLDRKLLLPASGGGAQAKSGFVPDLLQPMTSCIEDQPPCNIANLRATTYTCIGKASAVLC